MVCVWGARGSTRVSRGRRKGRNDCENFDTLNVVSGKRNRWGRVSRLRGGQFKEFWGALGHQDCLLSPGAWARGDQRSWLVSWSERVPFVLMVVGDMGSNLVSLHLKSRPLLAFFTCIFFSLLGLFEIFYFCFCTLKELLEGKDFI